MVEHPIDEPYRAGHIIDVDNVVLDLYRLLSIFYASKRFAEINNSSLEEGINYLAQFESSEITRILINSSIIARIIDDRDDHYLNEYDTKCGSYVDDIDDSTKENDLTLREACNKIIHANRIHSDLSEINCNNYLNPTMYFYGEFRKKHWKATVEIERYVFCYVDFIARWN